jgi:hypothetical protein
VRGILDAKLDIIIIMGIFKTKDISMAATIFAPGKAESEKNTPHARTAPTGAEKTALNTIASKADASLTKPELFRTNRSGFPVEKLVICNTPQISSAFAKLQLRYTPTGGKARV